MKTIEELNPDTITAAAIIRDTERNDPDGRDTEESVIAAMLLDYIKATIILRQTPRYTEATRKVLYGMVDQQR